MSWIEIKLDIPDRELEHVSAYLFAQGCEGINMTDDSIIIYFNLHRWSDEIKRSLVEYIAHFIPGFGEKNFQISPEAHQQSEFKNIFCHLKVKE